MSLDAWDTKCSEPDLVDIVVRMTGTGAAQPTKVLGRGVTLNRTGVGVIQVIFQETGSNLGTYAGVKGFGFDAVAQAGLKGYTVVASPPVASGQTMVSTLNITSATDALVDLAAAQNLTITFMFKRSNG